MHRPKKEFMPTTLSDLNIDTISLGSNSDRHNNNANGARYTGSNLSRSKATSSFNLASHNTKLSQSRSDNHFSRSSKLYGSQSNISSTSSSVNNNYDINSPTATTTPLERWEKAWEDNNDFYRPESMTQQQQQQHSLSKHVSQSKSFNSFNQNSSSSNRSQNVYVDDPFDDPWSGILFSFSRSLMFLKIISHTSHYNYMLSIPSVTQKCT